MALGSLFDDEDEAPSTSSLTYSPKEQPQQVIAASLVAKESVTKKENEDGTIEQDTK